MAEEAKQTDIPLITPSPPDEVQPEPEPAVTSPPEHHNFKNLQELKALEKSLKRETSRIKKPPQVKFQPYIFTSLEPYYDTSLVRYMMENPHGPYPGYRSRQTALGLCDPAEDLKLDTHILPKVSVKTFKKIQDRYKKGKKSSERQSLPKSSSTRSSTFPMVNLQSQNMTKRQLTFSDVPMLRKELQQKCTMNSQKKILQDYQRTKEDFYRLELNRLDEIPPVNRANVRASYFAYLQNTPGSRKAIYDCIQKQTQK